MPIFVNQLQIPMPTLTDQLGQLCRLVLSFQSRVSGFREKMFNTPSVTDQYVWAYMFGINTIEIDASSIYNFLHKHGKVVKLEDCHLLCHRYSSYRNAKLNMNDLWTILHPKTIKHAQSIMKSRRQKIALSKNLQISFHVKDALLEIIEQTLLYQKFANLMKFNISSYMQDHQQEQFILPKIEPKYLQAYLIKSTPQFRIYDCQIILKHVLGNHKNEQKTFYSFFHPYSTHTISTNPMHQIIPKQFKTSSNAAKFFNNSKNIWKYGKKTNNHNQPLYLL